MKKVKKVVKKTEKKETKMEEKKEVMKLSDKSKKNIENLMKRLNFKKHDVPKGWIYTVYIAAPSGRETVLSIGINEEEGYCAFAITGQGMKKNEGCQTIRLATLKTSILENDIDLVEEYISKLNDALII